MDITDRHPATVAALKRLEPNDNLPTEAFAIATEYFTLAQWLVNKLPDDPDLVDGLRKLWESKNCTVYVSAVAPPTQHKPGEPW